MNTASQDLPHHLDVLRERMLHPSDYETAIYYFLDEFAGDEKFVRESEPDDAPHLLGVLIKVAEKSLGQGVKFDQTKVFRVPSHGFYHGNATVAGRVVLFFYFQKAETGIASVIPGSGGAMDVLRFRLPAGLTNPQNN